MPASLLLTANFFLQENDGFFEEIEVSDRSCSTLQECTLLTCVRVAASDWNTHVEKSPELYSSAWVAETAPGQQRCRTFRRETRAAAALCGFSSPSSSLSHVE